MRSTINSELALLSRAGMGVVVLLSSSMLFSADKMYWADVTTNSIYRSDLDGSDLKTVLSLPLSDRPRSRGIERLALDASAGRIYWINDDTQQIQPANLDGSQNTTIENMRDVVPSDITNDPRVLDDGSVV